MKNLRMTLLAGAAALTALTSAAQKEVKTINDAWSFRYPDSEQWSAVSLPHTYSLDAYRVKKYYRGKGEYRRNIRIAAPDRERRYFLKFDAANKAARVSVNGHDLGEHAGGYSAFCHDVTPLLREGDNEVRVTVDNDRDDIGPLSADYTFFGGLYRDAWLITTAQQHFDLLDNASTGVYVTTPEVTEEKAVVRVRSRVVNDADARTRLTLALKLTDGAGNTVAAKNVSVSLKPGETSVVETALPEVKQPRLWSPDSPALYTLTATLTGAGGRVLDETAEPVGFRWFSFDGPEGFRLNGRPLKLRGVNRHQDVAPAGFAVDDEAHRRDMALLRDLGANFVRLAHYQQDDAVLNECDRLGLIVWEEIPIVNNVPDAPGFGDNCEANLVEMIRQHYNHPSVLMWGYMNEILLRTPGDNSPEWPATRERIVSLARRLEKKLKEEDTTRASVMAFNGTERYNTVGLDVNDVQGWNLYQGWYGAELSDFERFLEDQKARYPRRSLIVSEWGAGSDRRLHSADPVAFDFSTEYQHKYIEHYLPYIENNDYISGAAYWNFIDFNVGEREESMPRVNNKGLFYNDRRPKDVAYYFKSMWRDDIPVMRIAVRDRDVIVSRDGKAGVKIYSNCPEVELFVNGVSQGVRPTDNCNTIFTVELPQGVSTLIARGKRDGASAEDVATVTMRPLPDLGRGETLTINVGSGCDFTSAFNGVTWLADKPYEPGSWGYTDGRRRSTTSEIFDTFDTPLFQTMLDGVSEYLIDAPAGRYEVELLFADINKAGSNSPYLLGRDAAEGGDGGAPLSMKVEIDGRTVESDFAPSRESGYQRAVRKRYVVSHDGGPLRLRFTPLSGSPLLSGIAVHPL